MSTGESRRPSDDGEYLYDVSRPELAERLERLHLVVGAERLRRAADGEQIYLVPVASIGHIADLVRENDGPLTRAQYEVWCSTAADAYFKIFFPEDAELLGLYQEVANANVHILGFDRETNTLSRPPGTPDDIDGEVIDTNLDAIADEIEERGSQQRRNRVEGMIIGQLMGIERGTEYLGS